jgi:hypothetical protein
MVLFSINEFAFNGLWDCYFSTYYKNNSSTNCAKGALVVAADSEWDLYQNDVLILKEVGNLLQFQALQRKIPL